MIAVNWKPNPKQLRNFGLVALVAFGAIGAWIFAFGKIFGVELSEPTSKSVAWTLWGLAGLCGVLGLSAPKILWPLYVALTAISLPIGFIVSYLIMGFVYYLVLTPIGLFFRLMGRDPLERKFDSSARSYWVPREQIKDVKRYLRQF